MSNPNLRRCALALCPMLAIAAVASAQSRQVMVRDDGNGREVSYFSMPDFQSLRTPDYIRDDLPAFYDKLRLEEPQKLVVQLLLEAYLKAFDELADETLPETPPMFTFGGGGGPMHGAGEMAHGDEDMGLGDVLRGIEGLDIDVDGGSGEVAIRIAAGGGGPGGAGAEGEGAGFTVVAEAGDEAEGGETPPAQVMIAVSGEGVELSDEDMKALEEKAAEMLEKVQAQMEEGGFAWSADPSPEAAEQARERMSQMQERMKEMAERAEAFARARQTLAGEFENNVQSQLSIEQIAGWPELERVLVRRKTLPRGRLDAERTDLLKVLESITPTSAEREDLAEQIDAYELDLHEALVARNAYLEDANSRVDDAIREGDYDKALSVIDKAKRLRVAVRETNRQHLEQISGALPDDLAEQFRVEARKRFHPRVYRRTLADRSFAAAQRLAGDDATLTEQITVLEEAYRIDRTPLDEAIVKQLVKHQPDEPRRGIEQLKEMNESGEGTSLGMMRHGDDAVHQAFAKRDELDKSYMNRLKDLFPPELAEQLPKARKRQPVIIRR